MMILVLVVNLVADVKSTDYGMYVAMLRFDFKHKIDLKHLGCVNT